MAYQQEKFEKLIDQVKAYTPNEGINHTPLQALGTYRMSTPLEPTPEVETPAIVILLQGTKACYVAEKKYVYDHPQALIGLYPVPVETEIMHASAQTPFLAVGILFELERMADLLLRINHFEEDAPQSSSIDSSAKFSLELTDQLIDPFLRLFETLVEPRDIAVLGDAIIDEIYYRLLCSERGGELRALMQQKGKIKRISKAIDYIHDHMEESVSVEKLASVVHMSRTAFYTNFKEVMNLSPLQYAKSVKLLAAQKLIQSGRRVTETSHMVGYNNLAQFSREYKREFGYSPSATKSPA